MNRFGWAALAAAVGGVAAVGEPRAVEVLARGDWPHLPTHAPAGIGTDREPQRWVVRTPEELAKAAGPGALVTVPKTLKVGRIDFGKQMLLAVGDGTQPQVGVSGGGPPSALYAVSITSVERDEKANTLAVRWRRVPRDQDGPVLSRPLEAVLVPKFDGEVKFDRLPPSDQPGAKGPPPAGTVVEPVARALWPDGWSPEAPRREWTVRSEDELIDPRLRAPEPVLERMRAEARARYEKALKVDRIDFDKQMVVGVSAGVRPAGTRVEVTKVRAESDGKTLTVTWREVPPGPKPAEGIAHPAEVVVIEKFPGTVRFRQDGVKKD